MIPSRYTGLSETTSPSSARGDGPGAKSSRMPAAWSLVRPMW
jgi:hypothetical protein